MAKLRDSLSISPAIFPSNSDGLAIMKSFGSTMAAARKAKAEKNKLAETAALKYLNTKIGTGMDVDMTTSITPRWEDLKKRYVADQIKYDKDMPPELQLQYENDANTLVDEVGLSALQRDALKTNVALLHSDSDVAETQKFDHTESEKRMEIIHDPTNWLDKNESDPLYSKVLTDWNSIKNDPENKGDSKETLKYKFRTAYQLSKDYGLQDAADVWDTTKYLKDAKASNIIAGTSNPTGDFILDNKVIGPNKENNAIRAAQMYATGKTKRGNPISQFLDAEYAEKIKNDDTGEFSKNPINQSAETYGINQLYEGLNAKSVVSDVTTLKNIPASSGAGSAASKTIMNPYTKNWNLVGSDGTTKYTVSGPNTIDIPDTQYRDYSVSMEYNGSSGGIVEKGATTITGKFQAVTQLDIYGKKITVGVISDEANELHYVPLKDVVNTAAIIAKKNKQEQGAEYDFSAYPSLKNIVDVEPTKTTKGKLTFPEWKKANPNGTYAEWSKL